jgi:hypothetical protein
MRWMMAVMFGLGLIAACDGGGGSTDTASGSSSGGSSSGGSSSGGSSSGGSSSGGSSSGGSSGGASPGQEDAYCQAKASHDACKDAAAEPCDEDGKCLWGRLASKTAADVFFACWAAPSCKSADPCSAQAGLAAGGATAEAYFDECSDKLKACPDSFHDDLCSPSIWALPGLGEAAQACMSKPCNELEACLDAALKPASDCKQL